MFSQKILHASEKKKIAIRQKEITAALMRLR